MKATVIELLVQTMIIYYCRIDKIIVIYNRFTSISDSGYDGSLISIYLFKSNGCCLEFLKYILYKWTIKSSLIVITWLLRVVKRLYTKFSYFPYFIQYYV